MVNLGQKWKALKYSALTEVAFCAVVAVLLLGDPKVEMPTDGLSNAPLP